MGQPPAFASRMWNRLREPKRVCLADRGPALFAPAFLQALPPKLTMSCLDLAPIGILVADMREGLPLTYVNRAFEQITGYAAADALGRNCRYLQGSDRLQPQIAELRHAIEQRTDVSVTLRNYRRDGSLFWNALYLTPVADGYGEPTHYIGFMQDVTRLRETAERLDYEVQIDGLTGTWNRSAFFDHVSHLAADPSASLLLVKLDIAKFHDVNSGYGYDAGDAVLRQVADRLRKLQSAAVGRLGPDEFAIAYRLAHRDEADAHLATVSAALAPRYVVPGAAVSLRFALGYTIGDPNTEPLTLLRRAGVALHNSRSTKLREVRRFDSAEDASARNRIRLSGELQQALANNELILDYQPKIDLATGALVGAEALLRWEHALFGRQMPDRFIGLAEETGLILDIGAWGLKAVCEFACHINRGRKHPLTFAVNVSTVEFVHRDMVRFVSSVLAGTGAEPRWLTLELTETLLAESSPKMLEVFKGLRELGVGLALDDFGTGYSSLRYLQTFPVTEIKLDRCFVQNMQKGSAKHIIVEAVTRLGHELGIDVVAEGIETDAELALLRELRCPYGQGYLFSYPISADAFAELAQVPSGLVGCSNSVP